jgi:hypothetical protein
MDFNYSPEDELAFVQPEIKILFKDFRCPVHKRKAKIESDYDNEGLNAYVSEYCCPQFAQQVEQILWDTQRFRTVTVDKQ